MPRSMRVARLSGFGTPPTLEQAQYVHLWCLLVPLVVCLLWCLYVPPLMPPVVPSLRRIRFMVLTVSNPRHGHLIRDTEALFVPFKGQFEDSGHAIAGKLPRLFPCFPAPKSHSKRVCYGGRERVVLATALDLLCVHHSIVTSASPQPQPQTCQRAGSLSRPPPATSRTAGRCGSTLKLLAGTVMPCTLQFQTPVRVGRRDRHRTCRCCFAEYLLLSCPVAVAVTG